MAPQSPAVKNSSSRLFDCLYLLFIVAAVSSWVAGQRAGVFKDVARETRFRFVESPQKVLVEFDEPSDDDSDVDEVESFDEGGDGEAGAGAVALRARQHQRDHDRAAFIAAQREEISLNLRLEAIRAKQAANAAAGVDEAELSEEDEAQHDSALDDFESQLSGLMDTWSDSWEATAADDEAVAADEDGEEAGAGVSDGDSWERLQQQRAWERSELDRMLGDTRLRVRPPSPPPTFGLLLEVDLPTRPAPRLSDPAAVSGASSSSSSSSSSAASTSAAAGSGVVSDGGAGGAVFSDGGAAADYSAVLKTIEKRITHQGGNREVVVLGDKVYVGRDIAVYKKAFGKAGFTVRDRPESGKISTKSMMEGDWSVVLCLALSTDHCFASSAIQKTQRHQRINRLQGLRAVLWSKDSFCRTVSDAGLRGDVRFENATFPCWQLPKEYPAVQAHAQRHGSTSYIVKPLTMGGGMGISVVDGEKGLHKVRHKTLMVQTYLPNPYLIHGHKWDVRTYVLVTSIYPMRAYLYSRGLVRFATKAYDPNAKKGGKRAQFLTNTSVNKHHVKKGNVTDITWSFDSLREYCEGRGVSFERLLSGMERAISLVLLSAEQAWLRYFTDRHHTSEHFCSNCYQVMGVDLIVDSNLHPRVIEVNGQPSMKLTKEAEDHYTKTKSSMVKDLVSLVFHEANVATELNAKVAGIDGAKVAALNRRSWEYLLDSYREAQMIGQFRRVYPSFNNADVHRAFLAKQNPDRQRMHLHDVAVELAKQDARAAAAVAP